MGRLWPILPPTTQSLPGLYPRGDPRNRSRGFKMTTIVSKLEGPLSEIIVAEYGKVLSKREIEMLDHCQKLGEVWVGYVDGHFVCCWGLIPPSFLSNQAYIWMWAHKNLPHQLVFIRHSQIQVKKFLERYASITGHC